MNRPHSPTFLSLHLRHSSFSNPSSASRTHRLFTYVTWRAAHEVKDDMKWMNENMEWLGERGDGKVDNVCGTKLKKGGNLRQKPQNSDTVNKNCPLKIPTPKLETPFVTDERLLPHTPRPLKPTGNKCSTNINKTTH